MFRVLTLGALCHFPRVDGAAEDVASSEMFGQPLVLLTTFCKALERVEDAVPVLLAVGVFNISRSFPFESQALNGALFVAF